MKKCLLVLFLVLTGLSSNAQVYKSIKYYDKFDDEINLVQRKTLITKTDSSTFVIEEKGKEPVEYFIHMVNDYFEASRAYSQESTKTNLDKLQHFWLFIVHRTITTQYTGAYLDELFWIQDELSDGKLGKDINRIIYLKQ